MDGATLLCERAQAWDHAYRGQTDRGTIPSGVFCLRKGREYYPTVLGVGRREAVSDMELCLVREPQSLRGKATVTAAGPGSVLVTNTGPAPLKVGERFVVVYPDDAAAAAQREAVRMAHTRHHHPRLAEGADLWGGFMATVAYSSAPALAAERFAQDVEDDDTGPLYALGRLWAAFNDAERAGRTYPLRLYRHLRDPAAVLRPRGGAAQAANGPAYAALLTEAVAVCRMYEPRATGIVQHASVGNSATIPPGAQFHGQVAF